MLYQYVFDALITIAVVALFVRLGDYSFNLWCLDHTERRVDALELRTTDLETDVKIASGAAEYNSGVVHALLNHLGLRAVKQPSSWTVQRKDEK